MKIIIIMIIIIIISIIIILLLLLPQHFQYEPVEEVEERKVLKNFNIENSYDGEAGNENILNTYDMDTFHAPKPMKTDDKGSILQVGLNINVIIFRNSLAFIHYHEVNVQFLGV